MNSSTGTFQANCSAQSGRLAWLCILNSWALLFMLGSAPAGAASNAASDFRKVEGTAARIQSQPALGIKTVAVQLRPVQSGWQQVERVQMQQGIEPVRTSCGDSPVKAGRLIWRVSEDVIYLSDPVAGQSAHLTSLSSANIRPHEIAYDEKRGEVWLFGDGLYRYRESNQGLEKLQISGQQPGRVRKVIPAEYGLWLVTEQGLFLLDEQGKALKQVEADHLHGHGWVNAVAAADGIWLAGSDSRLLHLTYRSGQVSAETTSALPGIVAEMASAGNRLWLLLGSRNGGDFRLVFVSPHEGRLNVLEGKYYALQQDRNELLARSYATLFRINPETLNVVRIDLDNQYLLSQTVRNSQVSFIGSSYIYKDGCEIVERGRFDLSRGWHGPAGVAILDDLKH